MAILIGERKDHKRSKEMGLGKFFKVRKVKVHSDALDMDGEFTGLETLDGEVLVNTRKWDRKNAKTPRMNAQELALSKQAAGHLTAALKHKMEQYESMTGRERKKLLEELEDFNDQLMSNIIVDE